MQLFLPFLSIIIILLAFKLVYLLLYHRQKHLKLSKDTLISNYRIMFDSLIQVQLILCSPSLRHGRELPTTSNPLPSRVPPAETDSHLTVSAIRHPQVSVGYDRTNGGVPTTRRESLHHVSVRRRRFSLRSYLALIVIYFYCLIMQKKTYPGYYMSKHG